MPSVLANGEKRWTMAELKEMNEVPREIYYRLHNRDQNFIMIIVGKPGSGKSYAALRFAEVIDPNFDVEKQVIFTPKEFMSLIKAKGREKLHNGAVVIWEEVGVNMSARDWYSTINKQIVLIMQTFRKKHICLILTVPEEDFIDTNVKKLLNARCKMLSIDRKKKESRLTFRWLEYDSKTRINYEKIPRVTRRYSGLTESFDIFILSKVGEEISRKYEAKRAKFAEDLENKVDDEINAIASKEAKPLTTGMAIQEVLKHTNRFRNREGAIDALKISMELNIGMGRANLIRKHVISELGE